MQVQIVTRKDRHYSLFLMEVHYGKACRQAVPMVAPVSSSAGLQLVRATSSCEAPY